MLEYAMGWMLDTGDTVVVVYTYLLLFIPLSMKICDSAPSLLSCYNYLTKISFLGQTHPSFPFHR
jgi:hypothetical protein